MAAKAPPAPAAAMPRPTPVRPVPPPINSPQYQPPPPPPGPKQSAAWRLKVGKAVPWLFLVFLGGVVMQIALAGAGLLGDDGYWASGRSDFLDAHVMFVHILELFPLLFILTGFIGADRQAGWAGVVLFLLFGAQYALIEQEGVVRSFHVLNALVIFTLALLMTLSRIPWRPRYIDARPAPKLKA